jgi:plastocyanin
MAAPSKNEQTEPTSGVTGTRPTRRRLAALTTCALLASAAALAEAPNPPAVVIKNFMFSPTTLTVPAGSTVTWSNLDQEPHTVVSDSGVFRSGALDTSESFAFKFEKPGTYHFTCSIHPQMVGTVIVQ